jgi:hypothetical protein
VRCARTPRHRAYRRTLPRRRRRPRPPRRTGELDQLGDRIRPTESARGPA